MDGSNMEQLTGELKSSLGSLPYRYNSTANVQFEARLCPGVEFEM